MMNKRGELTEPIVDFWGIVIFIFIIILVYFVITVSVKEGKADMESRAEIINANTLLQSYLRTPVNIDGKSMQMSELIIEVYSSKQNIEQLKGQTNEILTKSKINWDIDILFPDGKTTTITAGESRLTRYTQASAILPAPDTKTIKITVYKGLQE